MRSPAVIRPPSRLKGEFFERSEEKSSTFPPSRVEGEFFERNGRSVR